MLAASLASPTCLPATLAGTGALVPYLTEDHLTVNPLSTSSRVDHAEPRAEEPGASATSDTNEHEMQDLEDLLSKLNPMVEEFVPPSPDVYGYYPANTSPPPR
jgi:hypothetical protein